VTVAFGIEFTDPGSGSRELVERPTLESAAALAVALWWSPRTDLLRPILLASADGGPPGVGEADLVAACEGANELLQLPRAADGDDRPAIRYGLWVYDRHDVARALFALGEPLEDFASDDHGADWFVRDLHRLGHGFEAVPYWLRANAEPIESESRTAASIPALLSCGWAAMPHDRFAVPWALVTDDEADPEVRGLTDDELTQAYTPSPGLQ
jgi:hypothetical protein